MMTLLKVQIEQRKELAEEARKVEEKRERVSAQYQVKQKMFEEFPILL
jgi:hypothetical protein